MGIFIQKNGTRYLIGGGTKQLEQRLAEIEQSRASGEGYGLVKLSDASAVTDSTGLALSVIQNNESISGSLANRISKNTAGIEKRRLFYPSIKSLGITSSYIPDIIAAMPDNSEYCSITESEEINKNIKNKMPLNYGLLNIKKITNGRFLVYGCSTYSEHFPGKIYIASVNMIQKEVNDWYVISGTQITT